MLTSEQLDELEKHADTQDAFRDTANITTDELRALIDAARLCIQPTITLTPGEAELLDIGPGKLVAYDPPIDRHAAFALVERELRERGVATVFIHQRAADVTVHVDSETHSGHSRGNTLIEAVDAAKGKM